MNYQKIKFKAILILMIMTLIFTGCSSENVKTKENQFTYEYNEETLQESSEYFENTEQNSRNIVIPAYSGEAYSVINNNVPFFTNNEMTTVSFERYSSLDELGRCGMAYANIGKDIMPTKKRGSIGSIKPSGWQTAKYDCVDGKYLYNRCHLIGFQLTGENANERNLITGTRYLNVEGMLPFENMVADYVKETSNHVLYRVTPYFSGNNLVADGVLIEAKSVEDDGEGITFCIYAYNVQPNITIDYASGKSSGTCSGGSSTDTSNTYILSINSKKFHLPDCQYINSISESNKSTYKGNRSDLINRGYSPCKSCKP